MTARSGGAERLLLEHGPLAEQIELERSVCALDTNVEQPAKVLATVRLAQDAIEGLNDHLIRVVFLDERAVGGDRLVDAAHLARVDFGKLGP